MWRRLVFLLLVCISLDFSDPNLPGALNFDLDQSVDAVHTQLRGQLPVAKTSIQPVVPSADDVRLLALAEPAAVRPVTPSIRRAPSYVRPRALLADSRPRSSAEPH
jgi:hypothetical protein